MPPAAAPAVAPRATVPVAERLWGRQSEPPFFTRHRKGLAAAVVIAVLVLCTWTAAGLLEAEQAEAELQAQAYVRPASKVSQLVLRAADVGPGWVREGEGRLDNHSFDDGRLPRGLHGAYYYSMHNEAVPGSYLSIRVVRFHDAGAARDFFATESRVADSEARAFGQEGRYWTSSDEATLGMVDEHAVFRQSDAVWELTLRQGGSESPSRMPELVRALVDRYVLVVESGQAG